MTNQSFDRERDLVLASCKATIEIVTGRYVVKYIAATPVEMQAVFTLVDTLSSSSCSWRDRATVRAASTEAAIQDWSEKVRALVRDLAIKAETFGACVVVSGEAGADVDAAEKALLTALGIAPQPPDGRREE